MLKILHVSPSFPIPANDGGKIVINEFYQNAKSFGCDVDFLCLSKTRVTNDQIREFDNRKLPEVLYDPKIKSLWRLLRSVVCGKSYLVYKFYNVRFLKRIEERIAAGNYDVVHFEGLHTAPYALQLSDKTSAKIVIRLHNIESQIIRRFLETDNRLLYRLFFRVEEKRMLALESAIYEKIRNVIFISDCDLQLSKIQLVKDAAPFVSTAGVHPVPEHELPGYDANDLVFIGSMDWKPNEDAVVWFVEHVFRYLAVKHPELKFFIVGKNPSKKVLSLATETIIVTGTVSSTEPYLRDCGISVIPIRIGGGMRVKILEQMAFGKPIVSTTVGAEGIGCTADENILIADTPEQFITSISHLVESKESRTMLGRNAYRFVNEKYDWKRIISELLVYYQRLISG
jgi:glycosyltransferase involved in cell wall biosynthesis